MASGVAGCLGLIAADLALDSAQEAAKKALYQQK